MSDRPNRPSSAAAGTRAPKLTEARHGMLATAAVAPIEWYRGDASRSRTCKWLFDRGRVQWNKADGCRTLVLTLAGRRALSGEAERG